MKSKKGQLGHGITWLWKFIMLVLVFGGVVAVIVSHYSKQVDVRNIEGAVVSRKLYECLTLNSPIEINKETLQSCLTFDENEIYVNVSMNEQFAEIGDSHLAILCEAIENKIRMKKYPSCTTSQYHVLYEGKSSLLNIFVAIRKIEKNL